MTAFLWFLAILICIGVMIVNQYGGLVLMLIGAAFLLKSCGLTDETGKIWEQRAGQRDSAERSLVVVNNVAFADGTITATIYNGSHGRIHSPNLACIAGGPDGNKAAYTTAAAVIINPKQVLAVKFMPKEGRWEKGEKYFCVADFDYMLLDGVAAGAVAHNIGDGDVKIWTEVQSELKFILDPPNDTYDNIHRVIVEGKINNGSASPIKAVKVTCIYDNKFGDYWKATRVIPVYVRNNETKEFSAVMNDNKYNAMKVRGSKGSCVIIEYIGKDNDDY